jgi:hypothetical protein
MPTLDTNARTVNVPQLRDWGNILVALAMVAPGHSVSFLGPVRHCHLQLHRPSSDSSMGRE